MLETKESIISELGARLKCVVQEIDANILRQLKVLLGLDHYFDTIQIKKKLPYSYVGHDFVVNGLIYS